MKKILFFILLLSCFLGQAQYTAVPDSNFEQALIDLGIDKDGINGKVLTADLVGVTDLDVSYKFITDLTGIEDFKNLNFLNCEKNKLTNINTSQNSVLTRLFCPFNLITSLDVSKNPNLLSLICYKNELTSLDVSKNQLLTTLYCNYNNLSILDVTKNLNLETLACGFNQFISLDVSKNFALKNLYCYYSQFMSVDISNNINLEEFDFRECQFTSIDVSKNIKLRILQCDNSQLTSLDVSKNTALTYLSCYNNQLTSLDVSKNTALTHLFCFDNQLTSLNLKNGNNTNFSTIELNFVNNPALTCIQVDNKAYSDAKWPGAKDVTASYSNNCSAVVATIPLQLTSTGNQVYCPKTNIKIVTAFDILHDPTDTGAQAIYVQISSGYVNGQDVLLLSGAQSTITSFWDVTAGKLTLASATGNPIPYADFIDAIKKIEFSNSSATPSGSRSFSISLGQANYLPSTQHYYRFISDVGVTWTNAKVLAENSTYFGLKGYLATLTALDEAKFAGEQASGAGWIGGSDAETPDVWKWVTGPEAGTIFWNGKGNGTTPNFAFWNTTQNEPNDFANSDEKYAHITASGVGISGSWNDLTNTGDADVNSPYHPKGYVVEYGGTPGDPPAPQITTSTVITIPTISATDALAQCDSGIFNLAATTTSGTIEWFDAPVNGNSINIGTTYITPIPLTTTTSYYLQTTGCTGARTKITATINKIPDTPIGTDPAPICGSGVVTLQASTNVGTINWYDLQTGGFVLASGTKYEIPNATQSKTYYAEAKNGDCINPTRVPVTITVNAPPVVIDENDLILCESDKLELKANITGVTYLWDTGETTPTKHITKGGDYSVRVTNPAPESCSATKKFTVSEHFIPKIRDVGVDETTVTVNLEKPASYYEYSINDKDYQTSNVFYEVPAGIQKAYVRETYCNFGDEKQFVIILAPKFFTPNNDGINDVWEIKGLETFPQATIAVFDRYGKLLKSILPSKPYWDGIYNDKQLPATDYWYTLKTDGLSPEKKGHFSLKR
jgi:gliding motility-associated-like protein